MYVGISRNVGKSLNNCTLLNAHVHVNLNEHVSAYCVRMDMDMESVMFMYVDMSMNMDKKMKMYMLLKMHEKQAKVLQQQSAFCFYINNGSWHTKNNFTMIHCERILIGVSHEN
jgi:hypothetical protein